MPTGELYAGSNDGPPLRSSDGVTWKPVTALVPKGHVWASAFSVLAVAGEVHVLGVHWMPRALPSFSTRPSWEGFFWNVQFTPSAPKQANCEPVVVTHHEQTGDAASQQGRVATALEEYRDVYPCKPAAMQEAYLAACRTRNYREAKTLYLKIGKESFARICLKEGRDPRVQP